MCVYMCVCVWCTSEQSTYKATRVCVRVCLCMPKNVSMFVCMSVRVCMCNSVSACVSVVIVHTALHSVL